MYLLVWLHFITTLFMTGLIWFVQVVHYPLFSQISPEDFPRYEKIHMRRTAIVVIPVMLTELITGCLIWWVQSDSLPWEYEVNILLLLGIWISTALIQAPQHGKLSSTFDQKGITRLVRYNWLRTVSWTIRAFLLSKIILKNIDMSAFSHLMVG